MVNMQTVDIDKIISVARSMAKSHNLCSVVDDALKEAGLLKAQSGMLKVEVPVNDFVDTVAYGGNNLEVRIYRGNTVLARKELDKDSAVLVPFTEEQKAGMADRHWLYSSYEGRVLHYYSNPETSNAAKCGAWPYTRPVKTSTRSENRRCAKCSA